MNIQLKHVHNTLGIASDDNTRCIAIQECAADQFTESDAVPDGLHQFNCR